MKVIATDANLIVTELVHRKCKIWRVNSFVGVELAVHESDTGIFARVVVIGLGAVLDAPKLRPRSVHLEKYTVAHYANFSPVSALGQLQLTLFGVNVVDKVFPKEVSPLFYVFDLF